MIFEPPPQDVQHHAAQGPVVSISESLKDILHLARRPDVQDGIFRHAVIVTQTK